MNTVLIGAGSDLGVHIDGAHLGPLQLLNDMKNYYKGEMLNIMQDETIIKSRNLSDRKKNEYEINKFNKKLYEVELEKHNANLFPITIGGDHSISIASALASAKKHEKLGMIWIDAHTDYNTGKTTVTGNIHGLPCATINGYEYTNQLREFFDGNIIDPRRTVIIGARSIDPWEQDNIKYSGVTVYTTEDIKTKGIKQVIEEAFAIATDRTKGVHISYDLDIIDPDIAPGVSVPEVDGLTEEEAMNLLSEVLNHINDITSFDIVEFNPLRDINRKTEQIAINIIARVIQKAENVKGKKIKEKKY
ncbi:MAG: arginase [Bacilli bacterium]|nr:arginase [Bacilli bacterium]